MTSSDLQERIRRRAYMLREQEGRKDAPKGGLTTTGSGLRPRSRESPVAGRRLPGRPALASTFV